MFKITCSSHNDCMAAYLCEHCGFLCDKHTEEESAKKHDPQVISEVIKEYYDHITTQEQVWAHLKVLFQIKASIEKLLYSEQNHYILMEKIAANNIQKYKSLKMGVDFNKLTITIKAAINEQICSKYEEIRVKIIKLNTQIKCLLRGINFIPRVAQKNDIRISNSLSKADHPQLEVDKCIIHYWKGSDVTVYDPSSKKKTTITLNESINIRAESISSWSRIFIIGGNLISTVYEVDLLSKTLKIKQPMLIAKYSHSLCLNNRYIYSIGGSINQFTRTGDCEKYDVQKDKWGLLSPLLTPRSTAACFAHIYYIYCFCGYSHTGYLKTMERLKIDGEKLENIEIKTMITHRSNVHGIQLNDKQAIVFGGFNGINCLTDCYLLNSFAGSMECAINAHLIKESQFVKTSAPVKVDGIIYAVDLDRRIHIYTNGKWEMVDNE